MKNKLILTIILCGIGSTMWAKMESPEMDDYTTYLMEADEYTTEPMGKESTPTSAMGDTDMPYSYYPETGEIDASPYGESMPIRSKALEAEAVDYGPEEEYLEEMYEPAEESTSTEMSMMSKEEVEPEYEEYYGEEEETKYGPEIEDPYIN